MPTRLRTLALHLGVHKHVNRHETSATSNAGHAVRVCAHRGCSTSHPENTLPALRAAVALGCEQVKKNASRKLDKDAMIAQLTKATSENEVQLAELQVLLPPAFLLPFLPFLPSSSMRLRARRPREEGEAKGGG